MLLILILELVFSAALVIITLKLPVIGSIGNFLLKEVFLTLFLFNCFNIAFSAGLHFRYATPSNTHNYGLSTLAALVALFCCLVIIVQLLFFDKSSFGEYHSKFKNGLLNKMYILISIVFRMGMGFYMAVANDHRYGNLFILAISFCFLLYCLANLPFNEAYQNYRALVCHCTQLVILIVTNFYSIMKNHESPEIVARIFTPAKIQIGLIILCVIVSLACFIYEVYLFFSRCYNQRKEMKAYPRRKGSKDDKSNSQISIHQSTD